MEGIGRTLAGLSLAGAMALSVGGVVACDGRSGTGDGDMAVASSDGGGDGKAIVVDAQDVGEGSRVMDRVTLDEDAVLHVHADMESGSLGVRVQAVDGDEVVWEACLSGQDDRDASLPRGTYYVIGDGGPGDARGTVTIEGAGL